MRTATALALSALLILLLTLAAFQSATKAHKATVHCYCVRDLWRKNDVLHYENRQTADDCKLDPCTSASFSPRDLCLKTTP